MTHLLTIEFEPAVLLRWSFFRLPFIVNDPLAVENTGGFGGTVRMPLISNWAPASKYWPEMVSVFLPAR